MTWRAGSPKPPGGTRRMAGCKISRIWHNRLSPIAASQRCTIIGVVKDFNLGSLRDPIQPLVLYWAEKDGWGGALVRTKPGQTSEAIASIGKVFRQLEPKFPFRYQFTDEEYQRLYNSEQTTGILSSCFSLIPMTSPLP